MEYLKVGLSRHFKLSKHKLKWIFLFVHNLKSLLNRSLQFYNWRTCTFSCVATCHASSSLFNTMQLLSRKEILTMKISSWMDPIKLRRQTSRNIKCKKILFPCNFTSPCIDFILTLFKCDSSKFYLFLVVIVDWFLFSFKWKRDLILHQ